MKELKLYVCDICHQQYSEKEKARYCEKAHRIPKEIGAQARYMAYGEYPEWLEVKFDDGVTRRYKKMRDI